MRGCRSSAALCVSIASMSIARHNMPVVLFSGIFATVPLFGVVMRYTIPPLFFVSYVGIVFRNRLCRSTNSYVPWCLVRAISVSAFPFFRQLSRMVCGVVVRLLRYASASRLCQLPGIICRLFIISYTYTSMSIVRHDMPVVLFGGIFATVPLLGGSYAVYHTASFLR